MDTKDKETLEEFRKMLVSSDSNDDEMLVLSDSNDDKKFVFHCIDCNIEQLFPVRYYLQSI